MRFRSSSDLPLSRLEVPNRLRFLAAVLGLLLLSLACEKESPITPSQAPSVLELTAPSIVSPGQTYTIMAKVSDPQGVRNVLHVLLEVHRAKETTPVAVDTLFDDGAFHHPNDGDVVAGDGIFTARLLWRWSGPAEQSYRLLFRAFDRDGNQSEPVEHPVTARKNNAPQILQLEVPAELPSGFSGDYRFRAQVADSQGVDDVSEVLFTGLQGSAKVFHGKLYDDGTHGDSQPADGWFELALDPSFGAGKQGNYVLRFWAVDRVGLPSPAVERPVLIQNGPPTIVNVALPDSVAKPASGSVAVRITATVQDPQTLADIKSVGFISLKPDSTYANGGQPIPMVDNGLPFDPTQYPQPYYGDETPGDGVFTFTMIVYSDEEAARNGLTPVQKGTYRFTFQAMDWVEQKSQTVERSFVVY